MPRASAAPSPDRRPGEGGFTILEVAVSLGIFAIVVAGLATSAGSGLRLVTTSNARQTATQLAVKHMELLRSTPYANLGLPSALTKSADPADPDTAVSASGTSYTVPGGATEPLVVLTSTGVAHRPADEVENNITYGIYLYVTWLDDPAITASTTDYKRATVVVQWRGTTAAGAPNRHVVSSVFSPGSVAWEGTAAASTTTTTGAGTTTTTTAPVPCTGDTTPPAGSVAIVAGTGALSSYTNQSSVQLSLSATDACAVSAMLVSNDDATFTAMAYATSLTWALAPGEGLRTVYVRYRDANGNVSASAQSSVRVDQTPPSTPGSFAVVRTRGASPRATLSWNVSTDNDTLVGYRVYRQIGAGGGFGLLVTVSASAAAADPKCPSSPCTYVNSPIENGVSYTYYIVAYDAAANESAPTAPVNI